VAQSHGAYRLRDVRNLLKRQAPEQQQFEFIQSHELIRPLTDYSQWVHHTFQEVHG
jgi:light-regulated signal transduction histidine kinase (bacteriophytochrome)